MLKIGLLGVGHLGKIHLKLLKEIEGVHLVGFYDHNTALSTEIEANYGVTSFANPESLMTDCDAVDIVTPTITHFDLMNMAIANRKHIFVEKPLVSSRAETMKLKEMCSSNDLKIQVGFVERFNPAVKASSSFIQDPVFIESHRYSAYPLRGTDVSVVLDMMIHDIDLIASWVKSPIQKVQAKGWKYLSPSDDVAKALLTFENGTIASVTANRFSSEKRRSTVVYQNNNQISIDFLNKKVEIIKQGETVPFMPQIVESNAIKEELTAFVNSITLNHPVAVPLTEGIQSMDIAFQIIEQINNR